MTDPSSVILAGGGTAGHVSPLLATADALRRRYPKVRITVLGSPGGLEERLVPAAGYDLRLIPKVAFPRRPNGAALRFPRALRSAIAATAHVMDEVRPDVIVGFGGYVSTPAYLAARRRRLPIVIHEQNAKPGLANKLGARFTPYVGVTFPSTPINGARMIGLPLRTQISGLDRAAVRAGARRELGLDADAPAVLVTGGSLGAQQLNDAFQGGAAALRAAGVQVLHVTGEGKDFQPPAGQPPYVVLPYCDRMDLAYAAVDLAVTRAGAGMVSELSTIGVPAVYVPLPVGNGEQRLNADDVVKAGGGLLVDNAEITPAWVERELIPLVTDAARLTAMSDAAAGLGRRDADDALVDLIDEAIVGGAPAGDGPRTTGAGS